MDVSLARWAAWAVSTFPLSRTSLPAEEPEAFPGDVAGIRSGRKPLTNDAGGIAV